jgi:hypothetical protein
LKAEPINDNAKPKAKANFPVIIKNPSKRLPVDGSNPSAKKVTFSEQVKVETLPPKEPVEEDSDLKDETDESGDGEFAFEMGDIKESL